MGPGTSTLLSSWFSANRTLFNARPVGASPCLRCEDGLSPSSTRIHQSSVWPCARPPLTNALQPGQRSDVPVRHEISLLEVEPPREWVIIWVGWESVNRVPLQTLRNRLTSPQFPLKHVNSALTLNRRPRQDLLVTRLSICRQRWLS